MKRIVHFLAVSITTATLLTSCVSSGRYHNSLNALQSARNDSARLADQVARQQSEIGQLKQQNADLKTDIANLNTKVDELTSRAGRLSTDAANKQSALNKS